MVAIAFDSHSFVKRLTAVGMPERQAEILAEEQGRCFSELVTRDILRQELKIQAQELTLRLGAMVFALAGFLVAVQYFRPPV